MRENQERPPLRNILLNFLNHIENLEKPNDSEDSYESEFQELKLFSESLKHEEEYSCSEGEKSVNKKKNRYKDILPFNITRVILSEYAGIPGSDYINANYIKGASGSMAYIASQGPLPNTVNDFWRMVVQCEVQVIIMACNEEESGKQHKCENYWVENDSEEKQYGMVTIKLLKASTICHDFSVRTMKLTYTNPQSQHEERTVCQFHYCAWPDHGVPPLVKPLLDMVRLVRDTQASETLPVLIHCSAGCGRTGTICAIDYVWGLLRAGKLTQDFSLFSLVRNMRKQRIAMVQTKEQYVLVHQAVRELFREQLKTIDSHPYENIDCNGMPLFKDLDPIYDFVSAPQEEKAEVNEKQDETEKNSGNSISAPLLPSKKRIPHIASKEEKEVENLSEKQRLVEQGESSCENVGSSCAENTSKHGVKTTKLKASCEKSGRDRRCSTAKQSAMSRSHSVGTVHKSGLDGKEKALTPETKRLKPARLNLTPGQLPNILAANDHQTATVHPIVSPKHSKKRSQTVIKAHSSGKSKFIAQIRRSKSMKAIRSDEWNVLTSLSSDKKHTEPNTCDIICSRECMASSSTANVLREKSLSLESIVNKGDEAPRTIGQVHEQTSRIDLLLDEQTRKFLQDCRQYLFGGKSSKIGETAVVSRVKERRNSFCQAVIKGLNENTKLSECETDILNVPKKPSLVRSYTALDMRANGSNLVKYSPIISKVFSPSKTGSSHKHSHPHSSLSNEHFSSNSASNSASLEPGIPGNSPLYQNMPVLTSNKTPSHSSPAVSPQQNDVYSNMSCKSNLLLKSGEGSVLKHEKQLSQSAVTRRNSSESISTNLLQDTNSFFSFPPSKLKISQEEISESQDALKKSPKKGKTMRQAFVSNTFPLQASKSTSSGYSSSSSMERTVRQPRINPDFRKSDPVIQNYLDSGSNKRLSQGNIPMKETDCTAKPYLIPSIGPRLRTSPKMLPNPTILKNRPLFPPSYQTACASSVVSNTNLSELQSCDALRNRPNPIKASICSVLTSPHHLGSSTPPNSCEILSPVRQPSVSNARALPPDHRYSNVFTSSQSMNHSPQNIPIVEPQKPYLAPSTKQSGCGYNPISGPADKTAKSSRSKPQHLIANLKKFPDPTGVRMRHGSRDDLALCGAASSSFNNRVKRNASVVISRGSLVETSLHPQSSTNWNAFKDDPTRTPSVNNHHHYLSCQQPKTSEYENWSEAPGIDLDKVAATLSVKASDSSEFMRKTLEGLHIRKRIPSNSPGNHEFNSVNFQPVGTRQQSSPSTPLKKQQQYL
ncbi:uncharacterized protein [Bemisia tabaci]|uniref:uncharacterized protein isoform X3 n=1 Tax=Bemisia tabaci TaxID=7038 RepID=UPI003B2821D4